MTQYVYQGTLTKLAADYILQAIQDYPFVVELSQTPTASWIDTNLKEHEWAERSGLSGERYNRSGRMYRLVGKPDGVFIFLRCKEDYETILTKFSEFVVNSNPFQTIIG